MSRSAIPIKPLMTIGYEAETVDTFLERLKAAGVDLVVDVRAAARSRRPGFAKTRLMANLDAAGIDYVHLRGLGTPVDGRLAARSGRHSEMHAIFREHLESGEARAELETLLDLVYSGRQLCLLCLEADPGHCHRSLVADAAAAASGVEIVHLRSPDAD